MRLSVNYSAAFKFVEKDELLEVTALMNGKGVNNFQGMQQSQTTAISALKQKMVFSRRNKPVQNRRSERLKPSNSTQPTCRVCQKHYVGGL